ncbi:MAG: TetR/AcrR family transcriptional regulator [Myxococcota bacterium]
MSKGEETKRTILNHALKAAARMGLTGLTIGTLAKELGMSKSGLFAHFGSKEALQAAVVEHAAELFTDKVIRPALKAPRGEPRVLRFMEGWFAWHERYSDNGCIFVATSTELDDRPGPARERLVAQQRDLNDFLASIAKVAVREGHFRDDLDPEQFAFETFGIIFAYHLNVRLLATPDSPARAQQALERLIQDARASDRA